MLYDFPSFANAKFWSVKVLFCRGAQPRTDRAQEITRRSSGAVRLSRFHKKSRSFAPYLAREATFSKPSGTVPSMISVRRVPRRNCRKTSASFSTPSIRGRLIADFHFKILGKYCRISTAPSVARGDISWVAISASKLANLTNFLYRTVATRFKFRVFATRWKDS